MIDPPRLLQADAVELARIHLTVPRAEIRDVMGPGPAEAMVALRSQGIAPAGPWVTRHPRMASATWRTELNRPQVRPQGPGGATSQPAGGPWSGLR
jgi:hypothetical protein